jgi:beta-aspartyl-peptidase (threonine type)
LQYLPKLSKLLKSYPKLLHTDTVGAVAVDKQTNVAAATSTGGLTLKIPGRIGDSPLIGCGNYADNETGACSATGIGEIAMKLVIAKTTCDLMRLGQTPQKAVETTIEEVNRRIKTSPNQMGLIAIDPRGRMGVAHNSQHMCLAYMTPQTTTAKAYLEAKSAYKDSETFL